MNQQRLQQNRPMGGAAGSVRKARERAEAGDLSLVPQPAQRVLVAPRVPGPNVPMNRMRPQMPPPAVSRSGQVSTGVAISQPVQAPQWPLAGSIEGGPGQYQPSQNRSPSPQRPPRPSQVPPMLDTARLAEDSPNFRYGQQGGRYEEDQFSPEMVSPMTQSSRPSTLSSVGSIPDFPIPVPVNGPPRRSPYLGPPPSLRRGAPSYYSQASFVSPIPEESPRPSHQSYASSAAIPTSWGPDSPRGVDSPRTPYDEDEYEDETVHEDDSRYYNESVEERGESRGSNGDDGDDTGLIRSASFGRRAKPSIITTKSSDRIEPVRPSPMPQQNMSKLEKMGFSAGAGAAAGSLAALRTRDAQRETVRPTMDGNPENPLAGGTGLIDVSTSSSETVPSITKAITINEPAPTYTPNPSEQKNNAMLGAYNAASSLQPGPAPLRTSSPGFSRLSAIRRPPRLDMDAVRDAEARGSLTSLPDLIKRATMLAAMMDRGKRPGSRMALNDFGSDSEFALDKETGMSGDEKHKSGLSGMLAAFPPPGVQTPQNGTPTRPISTWPSGYDPATGLGGQDKDLKKPRRCCGLPVWAFLLVLVFLLVGAAAAAVVVPLEFLVLHKAKSTTTNTLSAIQQCEANSATACKNGGASLIDSGSCACICTNGFTGSTCTSANATGCVTTKLSGLSSMNVTVGDSISRLISGAQTNFSVPLSASTILARFNSNNLSCATENALVTFDGESTRIGNGSDIVNVATTTSSAAASATATAAKIRRDASRTTTSSHSTVATGTGGIIYDGSSSTTSTTTSSSNSAQTSTNPLGIFSITEEVLDFARVAVLYILQQENLDQATNAQSTLQHFFTLESFTNMAAANLSVGNNNFVNLLGFSVTIGNGSVGAANSSLTRRSPWGENVRLWETPL